MGMGYKVELDNIVCVVAEQAYVSAKNKHSCVRWIPGPFFCGCLYGGWSRKLWVQLAAITSRLKGYINTVIGWLFS